ncbi:hypothetical protein BH11PAT2_BH11PAT2_00710 [soil metagenome]
MSKLASYAARTARPVPVYSCSTLQGSYLQLRDAVAWETFDESALTKYVTSGVQALRRRVQELSNFSHALTESEHKELFFMLESLLYVRSLLVEDTKALTDEENEP